MSSKERPTLGGTRIKTRKRNIQVPLNPSSFADSVVQIYKEHNGDLELIAKDIDGSELDFSRYGDTFFEVVIMGGRMQPGTTKPEEGSERHQWSVISCPADRVSILPHVLFVQKIIRRRPFLTKPLETVLKRSIQSMEMYGAEERKQLAILTALCFSQRFAGLPPEFVFSTLRGDALVAKGTSLTFLTDFFLVLLAETNVDEVVALLKKGKVEQRLLEYFPVQKQSTEALADHFNSSGLAFLAEHHAKVAFEGKLKELSSTLGEMLEEGAAVADVAEAVKLKKEEGKLSDGDVLRTLWAAIMDGVQWSTKNQQQNINAALRQVKTWGGLLNSFCTSSRMELELMYAIQQQCYEDAKLQKLFPEFVRLLYDMDVLAEDTVMAWYKKGVNPKGRQLFVKSLEPFVKWLEEAEEED